MSAESVGRADGASAAAETPDLVPARGDRRRFDVELLRIVASIAVIVLHTAGLLLPTETKNPLGGAGHWIAIGGDALGRYAVPAFFAITGWAVLMASPPKSSSILVGRVVRVLVPMIIWTALYLLFSSMLPSSEPVPSTTEPVPPTAAPVPTGQLAVDALLGPVRPAFHLWYLYGYVPLLILLGCIHLALSGRSLRLAGVLLLVVAVLPTVASPVLVLTGTEMPRVSWGPTFYQIVYAVGGAVLLSRRPRLPLWGLLPLHVLAFATVVWWQHQLLGPSAYGTLAVAVYTATSMLLIMRIRIPVRARLLIRNLASASFGVYLVHIMLLQTVLNWVVDPLSPHPYPALWLLSVSAAVVVASFLLSLVWGKLGLRRFLG